MHTVTASQCEKHIFSFKGSIFLSKHTKDVNMLPAIRKESLSSWSVCYSEEVLTFNLDMRWKKKCLVSKVGTADCKIIGAIQMNECKPLVCL